MSATLPRMLQNKSEFGNIFFIFVLLWYVSEQTKELCFTHFMVVPRVFYLLWGEHTFFSIKISVFGPNELSCTSEICFKIMTLTSIKNSNLRVLYLNPRKKSLPSVSQTRMLWKKIVSFPPKSRFQTLLYYFFGLRTLAF